MRMPWLIVILSLGVAIAALLLPAWRDLLLLAVPGLIGGLILVARQGGLRGWSRRRPVVVDGSNVMFWQGDTPSLDTLRRVLADLRARGFRPGVVFDANAGYKLAGQYQDDAELARHLGLAEDRVLVVPRGTPADVYVLQAARDLGARVVTNDRYRDWQQQFPEVARPGHLIRGGFREGRVWLEDKVAAG